jgi:hypothetical protein
MQEAGSVKMASASYIWTLFRRHKPKHKSYLIRTSEGGAHIEIAHEKPVIEISMVAPSTLEVKLQRYK